MFSLADGTHKTRDAADSGLFVLQGLGLELGSAAFSSIPKCDWGSIILISWRRKDE